MTGKVDEPSTTNGLQYPMVEHVRPYYSGTPEFWPRCSHMSSERIIYPVGRNLSFACGYSMVRDSCVVACQRGIVLALLYNQ
jgi:hypothetical protein